jgi:hypothetical protein
MEATKKKLDSAGKESAKTGTRSRRIERKLKDAQSLPDADARTPLGDLEPETAEEGA